MDELTLPVTEAGDLSTTTEPAQETMPPVEGEQPQTQESVQAEPEYTEEQLRSELEQYFYQQQAPAQQPQQPQYYPPQTEMQEEPAPFGGEEFDPYNVNHQQELLARQLQQALAPFQQFVESQQQMAYMQQQAYIQEAVETHNKQIAGELEKLVPGAYQHEALHPYVERLFKSEMQRLAGAHIINGQPNPGWFDPRFQKLALQKIAPTVKQTLASFGLANHPMQAGAGQTLANEMRVEGSNGMPSNTSTANVVDMALQRGDFAAALGALK